MKCIHVTAMLVLATLVATTQARPLGAQNVITLRANAGGRTQVAPGTTLSIPLVVDMSVAGGGNLGTVMSGMSWGANRLTFDSVTAGFGVLTPNTVNAPTGSITLSTSGPLGTTATTTMATVFFTAAAIPGATTVALAPGSATTAAGASILSTLRIRNLDVCVAPTGPWGDVNGDATVNILDAQQIARAA